MSGATLRSARAGPAALRMDPAPDRTSLSHRGSSTQWPGRSKQARRCAHERESPHLPARIALWSSSKNPAAICLGALLAKSSITRSPTGPYLASVSKMAELRSIITWWKTPFGLLLSERRTGSSSVMPLPAHAAPSSIPRHRSSRLPARRAHQTSFDDQLSGQAHYSRGLGQSFPLSRNPNRCIARS
jgi:hypothetical protein